MQKRSRCVYLDMYRCEINTWMAATPPSHTIPHVWCMLISHLYHIQMCSKRLSFTNISHLITWRFENTHTFLLYFLTIFQKVLKFPSFIHVHIVSRRESMGHAMCIKWWIHTIFYIHFLVNSIFFLRPVSYPISLSLSCAVLSYNSQQQQPNIKFALTNTTQHNQQRVKKKASVFKASEWLTFVRRVRAIGNSKQKCWKNIF